MERRFQPPIYGSKRSPTSDCYNAKGTRLYCQGPKLECIAFPHL